MNSATTTIDKLKKKKAISSFWPSEKAKSITLKVGAVVLVAALLGVGGWRISKAYQGKILPKVQIAGIKVGGKTPAEAKVIVQNHIEELSKSGPTIIYNDQQISSKLADMGVNFDAEGTVNSAYKVGRDGTFTNRVKQNSGLMLKNWNVPLSPKIDEPKLDEFLGKIATVIEVAPKNATLTISNGNINLVPQETGRGMDKAKLKTDLSNLINSKNVNGKITLNVGILQPAIFEDGTVQARAQAEKFMTAAPIIVNYNDSTWTANKSEIGSWIKFSESGNKITASIDPSKFIGGIADKIEVATVDEEIQADTNNVLRNGQDGLGIDRTKLTGEIKEALANGKSATFGVSTYTIPHGQKIIYPHAQPGRFPGRYIDVNLSEETLYAFDGTSLVNQFLISSGLTGPTPTGQFYVYGKSRVTEMRGPGYDLPGVEWVSWWSGDYSIHGTYWHHNFGHPMSHGCINASNGDAEWIYNWDEVGTPVYIHW